MCETLMTEAASKAPGHGARTRRGDLRDRGARHRQFPRRCASSSRQDPEYALRLLVSKIGPVQRRSIDQVRDLLQAEAARGLLAAPWRRHPRLPDRAHRRVLRLRRRDQRPAASTWATRRWPIAVAAVGAGGAQGAQSPWRGGAMMQAGSGRFACRSGFSRDRTSREAWPGPDLAGARLRPTGGRTRRTHRTQMASDCERSRSENAMTASIRCTTASPSSPSTTRRSTAWATTPGSRWWPGSTARWPIRPWWHSWSLAPASPSRAAPTSRSSARRARCRSRTCTR